MLLGHCIRQCYIYKKQTYLPYILARHLVIIQSVRYPVFTVLTLYPTQPYLHLSTRVTYGQTYPKTDTSTHSCDDSVCSYIIVVSMVSCYSPFHRDELNRPLYPVKFPLVVQGLTSFIPYSEITSLFYTHKSSYARSGRPNYDASVTTNTQSYSSEFPILYITQYTVLNGQFSLFIPYSTPWLPKCPLGYASTKSRITSRVPLLYRHHCRDFHCMDFSRYKYPSTLQGRFVYNNTRVRIQIVMRLANVPLLYLHHLVQTQVKHDHRKILAPMRVDIYNSPYTTYILVC